MKKCLSIIFISFVLSFLVFNLIPNEAIGAACTYLSCQKANEPGCDCGSAVTGGSAVWCCVNDNYITNSEKLCRRSLSCAPLCKYSLCEFANEPGCRCGNAIILGSDVWCCAGGGTSNSQSSCQAFPACPSPSLGPPGGGECPEGQICNPLSTDSFEDLLGAITQFIFTIALALAPVMLIIAGFMFVTSAGDTNRVGTAKKLAIYTLVGLAIILLASGLIKVLQSILGVTTT